ncbi:major facilitator transporter [Calothrix brevissima NIES-22]|nr:major facilitator transporter [Calothrix brevissima NIES-22]
MSKRATSQKLQVFIIVWFGQFISLIGSGLTSFALDFWVYQHTHSVTQFSLTALFTTLPGLLISPIAGALVDRWDRRWTMILSDAGSALGTIFITLVVFTDTIQIWHIYISSSIISVCNVFQKLAGATTTALLVPKKHLGHASGLVQIGESVSELFVPALAGILVLKIQLQGVLLIDFATYLFSLAALLIVKFPKHKNTHSKNNNPEKQGFGSIKSDVIYGWNYIVTRPGLLALLIYFAASNFLVGIVSILIIPMLLAFVSSATVGTILSIAGIGTLVGSLVMSVWGGPKRRIRGILGFGLLLGICMVFTGLYPSPQLIAIAVFAGLFCFPFIASCTEVLVLTIVPSDVQGRVFALQAIIAGSSLPLAYLVAGPLADYVFEPLLANNGLLAGSIGKIIGTGAGRGIGFLFIWLGILQFLVSFSSFFYRPFKTLDKMATNENF